MKLFAQYPVNELHLNFHPDDDFACYVNYDTKRLTFTPEEAAKYNALMDECFDVCEKENADIYEKLSWHNEISLASDWLARESL